mgnify:CR=1 FL=1
MNDTTPVGRITALLTGAGYRAIRTPLIIAGVKFEFPAVLVGTEFSPDLILVADTAYEEDRRLLQKVEGVARALDVARSKRPMTLVIAGPRPSSSTLESISRVSRVLPTGTLLDKDVATSLRNWLAVLMPLQLPDVGATKAGSREQIGTLASDLIPEVADLIAASLHGPSAVQRRLHNLIEEALTDVKNEGAA